MHYRALGLTLAILPPLLALSSACNCGGDTPPPVRDDCTTPDDDAVVTSMSVTAEHVYGFQGGQHVQARVSVVGSGLGDCTTFEAWIESASGSRSDLDSGAIPLVGSDTRARSSDIYFYVRFSPDPGDRVGVTMLGQTVYSDCISGTCAPDAGESDAGGADDAGESGDAGGEQDGGEDDGGGVSSDAGGEDDGGASDAGGEDAG